MLVAMINGDCWIAAIWIQACREIVEILSCDCRLSPLMHCVFAMLLFAALDPVLMYSSRCVTHERGKEG